MNSLKRFVLCAFAALGLLLPPAAPSHAAPESTMDAIVKRGTLRVGFSSFVPWAMQDRNGKYIGFEIDVAQRLADDLGVKLQPVPTSWDGIIPALLAGKFDMIIGSMAITPKRAMSVNFTVPYDTAYIDVTLNREKAGGIKSLADLNRPEVVVAVRNGTTAALAAKNWCLPRPSACSTTRPLQWKKSWPAVRTPSSPALPCPPWKRCAIPTSWFRTSSFRLSARPSPLPCARATRTR